MNICKFYICIYSLKFEYSERVLIVACQKLLRARVLRMLDDVMRRPLLHDHAAVHKDRAVGDVAALFRQQLAGQHVDADTLLRTCA